MSNTEFNVQDTTDIIVSNTINMTTSPTRIISIYKGDTGSFDLAINLGTIVEPNIYELQDFDIVNFYVMYPNSDLDSSIIYKEYTKDDLNEDKSITIKLEGEDTQYLNEGVYYYTIKLYKANGEVLTLQKRTKFIIMN